MAFAIRRWHASPPLPFMANAIQNFHFSNPPLKATKRMWFFPTWYLKCPILLLGLARRVTLVLACEPVVVTLPCCHHHRHRHYERQGLAGSWGKDTVGQVYQRVFSTSHFAPMALSLDLMLVLWRELTRVVESDFRKSNKSRMPKSF